MFKPIQSLEVLNYKKMTEGDQIYDEPVGDMVFMHKLKRLGSEVEKRNNEIITFYSPRTSAQRRR